MSSDCEFDYEYESATWTVNLSYRTYKERNAFADADGNRGVDICGLEPDELTILDHNLEDITFYVRISNPKLYKRIYEYAEERAIEEMNRGPYYDEDAWKGYD